MAEITVKIGNETEVLRFGEFLKATPARIKVGLHRAGLAVEAQIKRNLSGRRTPANPYPGLRTGRLRSSVTTRMDSDGLAVNIGPNTEYAAIHEYGGMTGRGHKTPIPARPYVSPAWMQTREKVIDIIAKQLMGTA